MPLRAGVLTAASVAALLVGSGSASLPASAGTLRQTVNDLPKQAVAVGTGGAVASDDVEATSAGLEVLRHGGNAIDAAVAVGATLGVADPFVAGIGGGGYLVYYDARTLPQLANHFYRQAIEERNHAMMIVQYLLDADAATLARSPLW